MKSDKIRAKYKSKSYTNLAASLANGTTKSIVLLRCWNRDKALSTAVKFAFIYTLWDARPLLPLNFPFRHFNYIIMATHRPCKYTKVLLSHFWPNCHIQIMFSLLCDNFGISIFFILYYFLPISYFPHLWNCGILHGF